jgi:hypothetical protein
MAPATTLTLDRSNVARTFTIANGHDAARCATEVGQSAYAAEVQAYEDSRAFRETNITMRTNRAVGF